MGAAARSPKRGGSPAQRRANLVKANRRKREIAALKAEALHRRLGPAELLADERAAGVKVLQLLVMLPRCTQRVALEALLLCQVNGARTAGELGAEEREAIAAALAEIGRGVVRPTSRARPRRAEGIDGELDRALTDTRQLVPAVELAPSEFAAARTGLEADPLLLRMVDRLVGAVRLYAAEDDGGRRARVVAEQWIRYRNHLGKLARGEAPPPSERGEARAE